MRRSLFLTLTLLAGLTSAALSEKIKPRHYGGHQVFAGTIMSLSADTHTIDIQKIDPVMIDLPLTLSIATRLRWRGKPIQFEDLKIGDPVKVTYLTNNDVQQLILLRAK
jgi:hypothetical protein